MNSPEYSLPPDRDAYFMGIALAVRERANCRGRRVGAVAVKDHRIISTGYNGTPYGMTNCLDGGCRRCSKPELYASGTGYDLCICVHAEQNALLAAARFGIGLEGSTFYSTLRPCFGCTKEMLQCKVIRVCYLHDWTHPNPEILEEYRLIQDQFPDGISQVTVNDLRIDWAQGKSPA